METRNGYTQLFFSPDHWKDAIESAHNHDARLFAVVDRRARRPKAKLLVVDYGDTIPKLKGSKMWKSYWKVLSFKSHLVPLPVPTKSAVNV